MWRNRNLSPNGLLQSAVRHVDGDAHTSQYAYADGVLTQRVNSAGHVYRYGYLEHDDGTLSRKGTLLSIGDDEKYHHTVQYRSETLSDVIYKARGLDQVHRYAYSSKSGNLTDHFGPGSDRSDAEKRGIHFDYDARNNVTERTFFDDEADEFFSVFTDYDHRNNPTRLRVAYNTTKAPATLMTAAWNHEWMRPSEVANAEGDRIEMDYVNGSLAELRGFYNPSNSYRWTLGYNADGSLSAVTNANGHVMRYAHNALGYVQSVQPAAGPSTSLEYDEYGNLVHVETVPETGGSSGRIYTMNRNALGWIDEVMYPDGLSQTYRYNSLGYLTNTVDRAGRKTDFTYAPTRELTSVSRYLEDGGSTIPVTVSYDLDQQMNLMKITEPRGRYVEEYQMDIQDRVTSVKNIEGQTMSVEYGLGSMVKSISRFDGTVVSNRHDDVGRVSETAYYGADGTPLSEYRLEYYADSKLKSISDGSSVVSNVYDGLNRLTDRSVAYADSNAVGYAVQYENDPMGNATQFDLRLGVSSNLALRETYAYDAGERLIELASSTADDGLTNRFDFVYHPDNGRLAEIGADDKPSVSYEYDILDRLTDIRVDSSVTGLIQTIRFDYNTIGMITNKVISGLAAGSSSYVYDSLDRLIEERREGGSPIRYRYDLAGNRTAVIRDGATNEYTLGDGNRLISWGAQGAAQYDAAGNTTNLVRNDGPAVAMNWDAQYRLADAETASNIVRYAYDAMGRRAARIAVDKTSGETNTEYYVYKNNHIVADVDENGNLMRSYVWGPDSTGSRQAGADNLLSMTVYDGETNTYYALKDHQNSVLAMTDADGHIVESYNYDAFGNVSIYDSSNNLIDESLISNRYLWQGREYDFDTGLYNFRARWYCSETGRWLSKDPIGISGGLNQYVFCANNPVNFVDPTGRCPDGDTPTWLEEIWDNFTDIDYLDPNTHDLPVQSPTEYLDDRFPLTENAVPLPGLSTTINIIESVTDEPPSLWEWVIDAIWDAIPWPIK